MVGVSQKERQAKRREKTQNEINSQVLVVDGFSDAASSEFKKQLLISGWERTVECIATCERHH